MGRFVEEKVLRDPIHGYVRVYDDVVWRCLHTAELQRLRRVRQLGSTLMVYHTGEHSRFSHSLGTYEIVRRIVDSNTEGFKDISELDKLTVKLAALLHDVGHAPFSHSFESILQCHHEDNTISIIKGPSEVYDCLYKENQQLPDRVASVIDGTHPNKLLIQLVSSQLDGDRMDYLLRDSYSTGVAYGNFDMERIIRTMRVKDDKLVVKESGMHAVEDYLMARYHMYWQVYYHPVSRSYDAVLKCVFRRLKDLYQQDPSIVNDFPMLSAVLRNKNISNEELYHLDDATCTYAFHLCAQYHDPILKDLASRILNRNLFVYDELSQKDKVVEQCIEKGFDPKYYVCQDQLSQDPYQPYGQDDTHKIWILMKDGSIAEISEVSHIVKAICQSNDNDEKVFYPKEIWS